jgi:thiol:disulfide interchange protein DsbA
MAKQFSWLVISSLLAAASTLVSAQSAFVEGEQYAPVDKQQSVEADGKIEVVEVFWYGCPHCFDFEPHLTAWLAQLPDDVSFRRVPAVFRRSWVPHARAYYAAEMLGVLDKFHKPLFDAIHRPLHDEEALVAFAAEQGIDEKAFREAYDSFGVDALVRKAALLSREYGIPGVPSIVVNGKYFSSGGMAGSYPELLKVVEFLVDKERVSLVRAQ